MTIVLRQAHADKMGSHHLQQTKGVQRQIQLRSKQTKISQIKLINTTNIWQTKLFNILSIMRQGSKVGDTDMVGGMCLWSCVCVTCNNTVSPSFDPRPRAHVQSRLIDAAAGQDGLRQLSVDQLPPCNWPKLTHEMHTYWGAAWCQSKNTSQQVIT